MTEYKKEDDYTLLATSTLPTGGTLCRYFNFAAGEVTTVFTQKEIKEVVNNNSYEGTVSAGVGVALTSQMSRKNFSEFDNALEIELMHAQLKAQGGNPPELDEKLTGKVAKAASPSLSAN